jgi:hypothetical protein
MRSRSSLMIYLRGFVMVELFTSVRVILSQEALAEAAGLLPLTVT